MLNITTKQNIERLPILISGNGTAQQLNAPKLPNGTGSVITKAVFEPLEDWDLSDRISGNSCDMTFSNKTEERDLCPDRIAAQERPPVHRVPPSYPSAAHRSGFHNGHGPHVRSGSDPHQAFPDHWKFIDQSEAESGDSHLHARPLLDPVDRNWFKNALIKQMSLRDDHMELLELTVIFFGQVPPR